MEILYMRPESKEDSAAMTQFLEGVDFEPVGEAGRSGVRMCMNKTLVFKECTTLKQLIHVTNCYKDLQNRQLSATLVITAKMKGKFGYAVERLDTFTSMGRLQYTGVHQKKQWVVVESYQMKHTIPNKAVLRALDVIRELLVDGWLHRDLHAGNLMFDPDTCQVRVIDLEGCIQIGKSTTPSVVKVAMNQHLIPFTANLCALIEGEARYALIDELVEASEIPTKVTKTQDRINSVVHALTHFKEAYAAGT